MPPTLLSFNQHRTASKKFIALAVDQSTASSLRSLCAANALDISADYDGNIISPEQFQFHCTMIVSWNETTLLPPSTDAIEHPITTSICGTSVLGKKRNVPVLDLIATDQMTHLSQMITNAYDLKTTWPKWNPHISLSYATKVVDQQWSIPADQLTFPIRFDKIIVADDT